MLIVVLIVFFVKERPNKTGNL